MSNLSATTREFWDRTVHDEVFMRTILLRLLLERRQVAFPSGTAYQATVDKAELDDLAQEYGDNEPLSGGSKTFLDTVAWRRKRSQVPLKISGGDDLDNDDGGASDGKIHSFEEMLVEKGQRAMRLHLNRIIYRPGSSNRDAAGNVQWQGIPDALTHDITYGGLTRATTVTNYWWQGASLNGAYNDWNGTITPTVDNFRRCIDAVSAHVEKPNDLVAITSAPNWRTLQSQVEGQRTYKEGAHAKYGFTSMEIDGVEVFSEPWLTAPLAINPDAATHANYFMMLNLAHWHLRLSKKRKLGTFTGFKWQGDRTGGMDEYLGRVLLAGNLMCTQPNASILRSAMTA